MARLAAASDTDPQGDPLAVTEGRPRLLHVVCPEGHKLDAPCTLDGQDVVCPYCGSTFLFSYQDSEEFLSENAGRPTVASSLRTSVATWLIFAAGAAAVILAIGGLLPAELLRLLSR